MPATQQAVCDAPAAPGRFGVPERAAAGFTAAYVAAAAVAAVWTGNGEFLFYVAVMLVLIAAVVAVHRRIGLGPGLLWALSGWGALHMAGGLVSVPATWPIHGEVPVLYSWWIVPIGDGDGGAGVGQGGYVKYDHLVHAYGFGVTTWLCWTGLRAAAGNGLRPTAGLMVLCAAAGLGFGALNEVVEFAATMLGPSNVGGYINTGWDLVANTVGATVAAALIYARGRSAAG